MASEILPDQRFAAALPLPLARVYRRFFDAKSAVDRYREAYHFWESGLLLLRATSIAVYAALPAERKDDEQGEEIMATLQSATLGRSWALVRRLVQRLADEQVEGFAPLRNLLLGPARHDLPRAAGLAASLEETLTGRGGPRSTVAVGELFDRIIAVRNQEWHGAPSQKPHDFYATLGDALLLGLHNLYTHLDPLAGRQLLLIGDVVRTASGAARAQRYELRGDAPRRLESIDLSDEQRSAILGPQTLVLAQVRQAEPAQLAPLAPLLLYDKDADRTDFLYRLGRDLRPSYVRYAEGGAAAPGETLDAHLGVLARLGSAPVDASQLAAWAARTVADSTDDVLSVAEGTRRIGDFELLSRLGQGGMGSVFRAVQPALNRQIALKCPSRAGDPRIEERFAREIRALGRVQHPNLIDVHLSGADGDQWYYVMELIDGVQLDDLCARLAASGASDVSRDAWQAAYRDGRTATARREILLEGVPEILRAWRPQGDWPDLGLPSQYRSYVHHVVALVRQTAEAVAALHQAQIIHRDIKPGNIMITADGGRPVLMDLGLAQLADDVEGRLTRTQQFVGTLRYASPEQAEGLEVDPRSDVYSLGATLWELLALRPVLGIKGDASITSIVLQLQHGDAERPSRHNSRVPSDLDAIVLKCLEKDPRRRYEQAGDLAADLARWERDEPVAAQPLTMRYLLRKRVARHRRAVFSSVAAVAALVVLGLATFWQVGRYRAQDEARLRVQTLLSAESAADLPDLLAGLEPLQAYAEPLLHDVLADSAASPERRTRAQLALVDVEPALIPELAARVLDVDPPWIEVIVSHLPAPSAECSAILWPVLTDPAVAPSRRFHAALGLARFDPPVGSSAAARWQPVGAFVAGQTAAALADEPSFEKLLAGLLRSASAIIAPQLVEIIDADSSAGETERTMAARLLADYAGNDPLLLTSALGRAGPKEFRILFARFESPGAAAIEQLAQQFSAPAPPVDAELSGEQQELHRVAGARRRATLAAALMRLDQLDAARALLQASPDPTARSMLIAICQPLQVPPHTLIAMLDQASEAAVRRALLLALSNYAGPEAPAELAELVTSAAEGAYSRDPDAGVHSAAEYVLHRWSRADVIAHQHTGLCAQAPPTPPTPHIRDSAAWWINSQGQTFALLNAPGTVSIGSPRSEIGRSFDTNVSEDQRDEVLDYHFAIGLKEVTNEEFTRFLQATQADFSDPSKEGYSKEAQGPVAGVSWLQAARYCRWLSEQEQVAANQMCFPPLTELVEGMPVPEQCWRKTGYRLPRDAEWEYACRAGSTTPRFYGEGLPLLAEYGWYVGNNAKVEAHRGGSRKPNDFGLFDVYGNGWEWCLEAVPADVQRAGGDTIADSVHRITRGGGLTSPANEVRSAARMGDRPGGRRTFVFRLARTLPAAP